MEQKYNVWTSTKKDWDNSYFNQPLTQDEIDTLSNADIGDTKSIESRLLAFEPTIITQELLDVILY